MEADQITVELLSYDASDAAVVNTARVSFAGEGFWHELPKDYKNDPNKLIKYLADHKHTTPFRHNSFSIRCKAPIFIARQLGKHQAGLSWNEVSRRYVDSGLEFYVPEIWRSRPVGSLKQGSGIDVVDTLKWEEPSIDGDPIPMVQNIHQAYDDHIKNSINLYEIMLSNSVTPEQARMVLPQSMETTWIWTGNLMSLAHCYNLRKDGHAQVEAQYFADALDAAIGSIMPVSWESLTGG